MWQAWEEERDLIPIVTCWKKEKNEREYDGKRWRQEGKNFGQTNRLTDCDRRRQWDSWHTVGMWCLWHKDDLDDDVEEEKDNGCYDENSNNVVVAVQLLDLRDGRQVGVLGRQADCWSLRNSSSQKVSLPVSQRISLNRPGLQIDPVTCNCLKGQGRPVDSLMREKVKREERKNRAMRMTGREKLIFKRHQLARKEKGVMPFTSTETTHRDC